MMSGEKQFEKGSLEFLIESEATLYELIRLENPNIADEFEGDFMEYIKTMRTLFDLNGVVPSHKDIKARIPNNRYLLVMERVVVNFVKRKGLTAVEVADMRNSVKESVIERMQKPKD